MELGSIIFVQVVIIFILLAIGYGLSKSGMIKGKIVTINAFLNGICVTAQYHIEPSKWHTISEIIYESRSIVFRCFLFFCAMVEIIAAIIG